MRIAFWNPRHSRALNAAFWSAAAYRAVLFLITVIGWSATAQAQQSNVTRDGNNLTLTCDGNFSPLQTLCKDGNSCNNLNLSNPPVSSASPQDNVSFVPPNTPVNVTWEVINPNTSVNGDNNDNPVSYSIDGIGTFSLNEGVTDVRTQTASSPPATKISVNHTGQIGNGEFGVVRYRVKCTPVPGKLSVTKISNGGPGTFTVNATSAQSVVTPITLTTTGGPPWTNTQTVDLGPGTYTISEVAQAGWTLDGINCGGATGQTASVTVVANQTATCTVTNTKQVAGKGTITIIKNDGGNPAEFDFTSVALGSFKIDTAVSTNKVFSNLTPGSFAVTETPEPGYQFTGLSCTETGGTPNTNTAGATANIQLEANESVVCTYTNTKNRTGLNILKKPSTTVYTTLGQVITYTYIVTNTGNVPLANVNVTDDKVSPVNCPSTTLAAGASMTCTGSYVITTQDLTTCTVTNVATVTATLANVVARVAPISSTATATIKCDPDKTREVIRNFINRRIDLLASNEPDRARIQRRFERPQQTTSLKDDGPMKLSGEAENGNSRFSFATSISQMAQSNAAAAQQKMAAARKDGQMNLGATDDGRTPVIPAYPQVPGIDVWVEGHFQKWNDDTLGGDRSGKFGILYVGADYLVNPWILIGALVQFDWMDDKSSVLSTDVSGRGWMAGPYVTLKLSDNIMLDARGAWGQSDNDIRPFNTYQDSFDTDRWLVKANLTGNWYVDHLRISPSVGVIYVEEEQHAYVDSLGASIASQSAHIGRLTFGPEFGYAFQRPDGVIIEPHAAFTGMWDFDKDETVSMGGLTASTDDFRVKVEGGLMVRATDGSSARATLSYDGIGANNFDAWGGQLWLSIPLN